MSEPTVTDRTECSECGSPVSGFHFKKCPQHEEKPKYQDLFGTPRDSELAEDFYLIVKVGILFTLGAVGLGFLMEIGRAIAGVVMG